MRHWAFLFLVLVVSNARTSSSQNVQVPAPAATPKPVVKPEDKCQISGAVVNAMTGEPLRKVRLSLRPLDGADRTAYGTLTDNAGHFVLDDVDPGRYYLMGMRSGFVEQSYSPRGGVPRQAKNLDLTPGQKMTEVVFKLYPQAVITGRIMDEDGEPLANATVYCMRIEYSRGKRELTQWNRVETNDLGEYRLHGLRPGRYYVGASYRPEMFYGGSERLSGGATDDGYATTFYPNSTQAGSATPIDVGPGAQIHSIDLRLGRIRTVRIRGRVLNLPAKGNQYTNVKLLPRDSPLEGPRSTMWGLNRDGGFELRDITPGSYILTAEFIGDKGQWSARLPIEVGAADLDKIELKLQPVLPGGDVSGRLVVEGSPPPNTDTTAVGSASQERTILLLARGSGAILLLAAEAQVKDDLTFKFTKIGSNPNILDLIVSPLDGYYMKSVRLGDQDVTDSGIDFTQGPPGGDIVVTISSNGGQVEGIVQNANREPAVEATVTLIPEATRRTLTRFYKRAETDRNGHFTFKGIIPGEYKVFAWEDVEVGALMDPDFLKPYESSGEKVTIKESARENVQLKLIPAASPLEPRP